MTASSFLKALLATLLLHSRVLKIFYKMLESANVLNNLCSFKKNYNFVIKTRSFQFTLYFIFDILSSSILFIVSKRQRTETFYYMHLLLQQSCYVCRTFKASFLSCFASYLHLKKRVQLNKIVLLVNSF